MTRDQVRSNRDYRLNYRLSAACEADIDTLCAAECTPFLGQACGGRVLRCLTEKQVGSLLSCAHSHEVCEACFQSVLMHLVFCQGMLAFYLCL